MADPATSQKLDTHARFIKKFADRIGQLQGRIAGLEANVRDALARPRSPTEMIDSIPGRRIESVMSGEIDFDHTLNGKQGPAITIVISQDGPFIQTHYPMVLWRATAPDTATNLNFWRPVSTFPLPDQVVDTDVIDLMYQIIDGGAGRNFQNAPRGPVFSRPDALQPLPVPTLWAPNSTLQFVPTYNAITFNGSPVAPTEGTLHVDIPGYRIVNL